MPDDIFARTTPSAPLRKSGGSGRLIAGTGLAPHGVAAAAVVCIRAREHGDDLVADAECRLTPRFDSAIAAGDTAVALHHLRRSLAVETALAFTILSLVAWLGTLQPPAAM